MGSNNVVIGLGSTCEHNNCVIIGSDLKSARDYQLIIGNAEVRVSRQMTAMEYAELCMVLRRLALATAPAADPTQTPEP